MTRAPEPADPTTAVRRWYDAHAEEFRNAATIEVAFIHMTPEEQSRLNRFKLWALERDRVVDVTGKRVLEFGCGHGRLAVELPGYAEYVGVDFSGELLRIGRERLARAGVQDRATLVHANCLDYDGPQDHFDVVCSLGMFSFVEDEGAILRKMASHLRPGGVLFIDGHFSSPLLNPIRRRRWRRGEQTGGEVRVFSRRRIRAMLRAAGLTEPRVLMREYPLLGELYARKGWSWPLHLRNTLARTALGDLFGTDFWAFARRPAGAGARPAPTS